MSKKQNPSHLENLPAERIVLGKVLQSEASYWSVADSLMPFHFAKEIHVTVFGAIKDILAEGKKLSLNLIQSRIGEEYDDGQSTMILMTALLRDAENVSDWETEVEDIIDKWRRRKLIETLESGLKEAKKPEAMSLDLLSDMTVRLEDISVNSHAEPLKSLGEISNRVVTRSGKAKDSGVMPGFDTGLPSLDEILGRIHPGDLGFIGASQGGGKTILGMQLAQRAAQYGPTIIFELEMKDEDLAARVLAGESDIAVANIEAGDYDAFAYEDLKSARDRLAGSRVYVDDRPKLFIEQMHDRCLYLKRKKGLICAVIDHLRLGRARQRFANKFDRMEYICGEWKAIAKDLGIAVIMLSQVTRSSQRREDAFPVITDLDGGGALDTDADWGVTMFRRETILKKNRPNDPESTEFREWVDEVKRWKSRIEIRSEKRRRGETGEVREFVFDGRRGQIRELER